MLETRFNAGVDFDDLYSRDVAERYCVLNILKWCEGHENRISRKALVGWVQYFWWRDISKEEKPPGDRRIRNIIRELRRNGALICSTGGTQGGYWIPTSLKEVMVFIAKELVSRAMDLLVTAKRMKDAAVRKFGGQSFLWEFDIQQEVNDLLSYHK